MSDNPFDFQIDQAFVDSLPEDQREMWQRLVTDKAAARAESDRLASERQFNRALTVYDSKEIAERLISWDEQYQFTDDEIRALLTDWWEIAEAWSGDARLREGMFRLLRRVAPLIVPGEGATSPLPEFGSILVFRGNLGEEPGGGSWTLDPIVAERFATMGMSMRGVYLGMHREDGVPTVWRGEVDVANVLAYFGGRGEREVVVPAAAVRHVERIAEARPS